MSDEFTVAAIVSEPADVLLRFVDWYQAQGAARIVLFFDDPKDPMIAQLAGRPGLDLRPCDAAFWERLGLEPDQRFTRRQNTALTDAYRELASGWLLNVDADELMYFAGQTIADRLAAFPADARAVRVRTAEHVHGASPAPKAPARKPAAKPAAATRAGSVRKAPAKPAKPVPQLFRLPVERKAVNRVYGEDAPLFRRRNGLVGHPEGKSFIRAGQPGLRLRQHWAKDAEGTPVEGPVLGAAEGGYLLHFAAPSYEVWRAKLDWRQHSHGFSAPVKDALSAVRAASSDPEPQFRALYALLHRLEGDRLAQLEAEGGVLRLAL